MKFEDLNFIEPIKESLRECGYVTPTPIQEQAIPIVLEGNDLLGCAQTGTGKTAAFALPIIQSLAFSNEKTNPKKIKALILTPTRELAIQIRDTFRVLEKHTDLKCSVIFGGVNQHSQIEVLKKGVDILVATPGRLLDLINQKYANLQYVQYLVLDEADTMLDMGFIHDVKKILSGIPKERQTLLFSATMPKVIEELASMFLKSPKIVKVTPVSSTVNAIEQSLYYVDKANKSKLLMDILKKEPIRSALVFTRTKHGANKLGEILKKENISCGVIHGNKSQNARVQALKEFKDGKTKLLIATDIAARGIDIHELSHVFNYEMPDQAEVYVHRIGRTGRAGLEGKAISFCNIDEKSMVKEIEKLTKKQIPVINNHEFPLVELTLTPKQPQRNKKSISVSKEPSRLKKANGNSFYGKNKKNSRNFSNHSTKMNSSYRHSNRGK